MKHVLKISMTISVRQIISRDDIRPNNVSDDLGLADCLCQVCAVSPEHDESDEPPVEGVQPLLGAGRVLHHHPRQARQLRVQLVPVVAVTSHVSDVTCHVSRVTCQLSRVPT